MRSLSIDQKKRFYILVDSFEKLEPHQQRIALERMRNDKDDPQKDILTLIELHFSFPPEPDRCYTGDCIRNFILKESIGSGGMGVVYKAVQTFPGSTDTERTVAVKLIHPALIMNQPGWALDKFQNELRNLVQLEHPSITRLYDAGIYHDSVHGDDIPFLAMEFVQSTTLRSYACEHRECLGLTQLLELFLRVCDAVAYAHRLDIIHLDLKPENILVDANGTPRIIDFGLAQIHERSATTPHFNILIGTPAYMSPEQVSTDFGSITPASDVYALGIILYELITERRPLRCLAMNLLRKLRRQFYVKNRKDPTDSVLIVDNI